jgi:ABC-type transporter Mla maintaining outer membrane lipid asymmetry ATPase subunit MlaF
MDAEWIIELDGVDVTHPDQDASVLIRGVNWQIGRGQFWVVGGPPGAGKSSLLTTAAGLNRPGGGTLRIFGRDLAGVTEQEQIEWRQWIGFVFEHGGRLLSHLTVGENVALPLRYHRTSPDAEIAAQVESWLERAGLGGCAGMMPSRFSPRLQQRLALARTLIMPKSVLFVDNPPGGRNRDSHWWREQLGGLAAQGLTVVVASNDFGIWLDTAQRFALVQDGQFSIIGGPEEVKSCADAAWREYVMVN